jgi:hypothetical protein
MYKIMMWYITMMSRKMKMMMTMTKERVMMNIIMMMTMIMMWFITIMRRMMRCDDNDAVNDQGKG